MPLTPDLVPHLEAKGHAAVHASAIGLATADDQTIIETARNDHFQAPMVMLERPWYAWIWLHRSGRDA